jgi:hypothetical protein
MNNTDSLAVGGPPAGLLPEKCCGKCKHGKGMLTYPGLPIDVRVCHLNPPQLFMFPVGQDPSGQVQFLRVTESPRVPADGQFGCYTPPTGLLN